MTSVGHIVTGIAIGTASLPRGANRRRTVIQLAAFAVLSMIPDIEVPHWGHQMYYFSHSLFINLGLMQVLLIPSICWPALRRFLGGWMVPLAGSLTWLNHLLLDSFYNHGYGIAIYWPFSMERLILPIPWLEVAKAPFVITNLHNIRVSAIEGITFFPLLLLVTDWRGWLNSRREKLYAAEDS